MVSHRICNRLSDCESDHPTTFAQPHVDCQQQRNVWIQHLDIRIGAARAGCFSLDLNWWRRDVVIFRVGRVHPGVVKLGRDLAEERGGTHSKDHEVTFASAFALKNPLQGTYRSITL